MYEKQLLKGKWKNFTARFEMLKQQRVSERRRQKQSSEQQPNGESRLCVLEAELQLEREKNRCLDLEVQLQHQRLQVATLERRYGSLYFLKYSVFCGMCSS